MQVERKKKRNDLNRSEIKKNNTRTGIQNVVVILFLFYWYFFFCIRTMEQQK